MFSIWIILLDKEPLGHIGGNRHHMIVSIPHRQFVFGVNIYKGLVCVDPCALALGAYLVPHNVVGNKETDGKVILAILAQ